MKSKKETIIILSAILVAVAAILLVIWLIAGDDGTDLKISSVSSTSQQNADTPSDDSKLGMENGQVTGADGKWNRTEVKSSLPAKIEISELNDSGFRFKLHAENGSRTGALMGTASFEEATKAVFKNEETGATIIFVFSEQTIAISHTGKDTELGCDDNVTFDGNYIKGNPVYTDTSSNDSSNTSSNSNSSYSKDLRKSQMILSNIKSILSGSDYSLYQNVMKDENIRDNFPESEKAYDKDGNKICVDREINAIKYYAVISGASTEVLLICKPDGKVYVAIYEVDEVRYYTNDSAYAAKAPSSFSTFAETRPATLKNMS